jgi:hypothetical protein
MEFAVQLKIVIFVLLIADVILVRFVRMDIVNFLVFRAATEFAV